MKKFILCVIFFISLTTAFFAQEASEPAKSNQKTFSLDFYFSNLYATGPWSEYVFSSIGGGGGLEYTLPLTFENCDLGLQLKAEYHYVMIKDSSLDSLSDILILPGFFVSLPFKLETVNLSLHPELAYGVILHNSTIENQKKTYADQLLYLALPMRLSFLALPQVEIEAAPVYSFAFEKKGVLTQSGFRAGLVWSFL